MQNEEQIQQMIEEIDENENVVKDLPENIEN